MNQFNYKKTPENVPFISNRADPYVTRHDDGTYYFTASVPEYDRIILRKSDSLMGLREAPEKTVWKKHESGEMSAHIWAPELHRIGDAWYLYFAAGAAEDVWAIRPYVLECRAEDPMEGPWQELGMMEAADDFSFQGLPGLSGNRDVLYGRCRCGGCRRSDFFFCCFCGIPLFRFIYGLIVTLFGTDNRDIYNETMRFACFCVKNADVFHLLRFCHEDIQIGVAVFF